MPETYASQPRAGRSTGPRTQIGKAIASRNSTIHGCCSTQTIINGESQEEFNELLEDWLLDYQPEDSVQRSFVEQAVHAQWILKRNTNRYDDFEKSLEDKNVLDWSEEDHKKFERFTRYKTTAERAFKRAFTQLEQLRKRRDRDTKNTPVVAAHARPSTSAATFAQAQSGFARNPSAVLAPESASLVPEACSEPLSADRFR